jgi:spore maturation protein SpmB
MVLFLAINTSAITLMPPTGTVAVRAAAQSADPFAIWIPTLIATTCSTLAAVGAFYLLRGRRIFAAQPLAEAEETMETGLDAAQLPGDAKDTSPAGLDTPEVPEEVELLGKAPATPMGVWRKLFIAAVLLVVGIGLALEIREMLTSSALPEVVRDVLKAWVFPLLIAGLLLVGVAGRVRVYESAIAGAREGLEVAVRIVPYLVAILVAVAMFRASGALAALEGLIDPLTSLIGIPAEVLPMALLRPMSGSGAFGVMSEILTTHGPDSFVGYLASTLQGSTETTFYVLTLYCGAAGIRDVRHALVACLTGDLAGLLGATAACHLFFG